mgnify:CR=1 FL=1
MSQTFKIRKGHDIKLVGGAPKTDLGRITASTYAVTPSDFPGITPKLVVKAGTQVKAGDTLFFDADAPHGPEVLVKLPARYLSVISYPQEC